MAKIKEKETTSLSNIPLLTLKAYIEVEDSLPSNRVIIPNIIGRIYNRRHLQLISELKIY